ncbi:MAG TPA: RNHCP domain-containing protein [Candidatus Paceibacterota bacterium]|nr:RNHCP domain-containing protein [Candidatus Paceibacterota bacterium]
MTFIKVQEDFTCGHCGASVRGTGYTNHCPRCLWSRHVDIDPGDRAAQCGGMMEPVILEGSTPEYVILHRCVVCGHEKRNRIQHEDSSEAIIELAKKVANS